MFCVFCYYWYHLSCLRGNSIIDARFPLKFHVSPCCIHGKSEYFFGYLSICSVLFIDWSKESMKNTYENCKEKRKDIKTHLEKYFKSSASIVKQSADATEMKILTKHGIANYFNKCYMSIITHFYFELQWQNFYLVVLIVTRQYKKQLKYVKTK